MVLSDKFKILAKLGPAFIASIAYVDPGNFAANITSGAKCGNTLLWILLWGNFIALIVQTLACRLGIFTNESLAKNCGRHLPLAVKLPMWITTEAMAVATDLAEVLGAGIGITLLFHTALFPSCVIGGLLSFIPFLKKNDEQKFLEKLMAFILFTIGCAFLYELAVVKPNWHAVALGTLVPKLDQSNLLIAASMLGATVMPHVIFLHSGLMTKQSAGEKHGDDEKNDDRYRIAILDNVIALNFAWLINSAMVVLFATVYSRTHTVHSDPTIQAASQTLTPLFGHMTTPIFGFALLFAGLSSTTVGSLAGQIIMDGFWNLKVSLWLRRALTLIPSLFIISSGIESTRLLVLSQVALSVALPFAIVPLVWLNGSSKVLGERKLRGIMLYAACIAAGLVVFLNMALLIKGFD